MAALPPADGCPAVPTAPPRRSRLRRLAGALSRWMLAALVAFVLAEVAVRALGLRLPARGKADLSALSMHVSREEAPGLERALIPGSVGTETFPLAGGKTRTVVYAINAQGFRDHPVAREKPPGTFRIAMVGDSVTYGTGVQLEDTLPEVVERELAKLLHGQRVEVLNCGVPATNTGQQIALLKWRVLDFAPDLVVLNTTIVDASGYGVPPRPRPSSWESELVNRLGLTSGVWHESDAASLTPAQRRAMAVRRRSALVDLLANRLHCALKTRQNAVEYELDWAEGAPGWEFVRRHLRGAAALSSERGFGLVVTQYPSLERLDEHYPFQDEVRRLGDFCASQGIAFYDLRAPLHGLDGQALRAHAHDRHPGPTAHRLVGRYLAEKLAAHIP